MAIERSGLRCSQLIWQAAGSPPMAGAASGRCCLCGAAGCGARFTDWVKDTFTNYDLLKPGEIICHACLFCVEEKSIILQAKTGRDKPQKMRTYSHFVENGEWFALSKADKTKMRELLAQRPQVAVIADSGQKHLLFRARPGWWQFEEVAVLPCWDKVAALLPVIEELMSAFSKTEIDSGHYQQRRIMQFGIEKWRTLDRQLEEVRLTTHFQIALFLAQKENPHDS